MLDLPVFDTRADGWRVACPWLTPELETRPRAMDRYLARHRGDGVVCLGGTPAGVWRRALDHAQPVHVIHLARSDGHCLGRVVASGSPATLVRSEMDRQEVVERPWDQAAGIPERLALLAAIGPALDPRAWRYNRSRELWYYVEDARAMPGNEYVGVHQKGSVSLTLIANKWHRNRAEAMILVGYSDIR